MRRCVSVVTLLLFLATLTFAASSAAASPPPSRSAVEPAQLSLGTFQQARDWFLKAWRPLLGPGALSSDGGGAIDSSEPPHHAMGPGLAPMRRPSRPAGVCSIDPSGSPPCTTPGG
jgi:hypothetical protein